jgi:hypothetical protein
MRSVISTNPFTHTGAAFLVGGRACSSLLDGMARCHPVPVAIKQHAGEEARLRSFSAIVVLGSVAGKLRLDRIPQRLIDDRLMFAKIRLLVVNDLAAIDTVLQHQAKNRSFVPGTDGSNPSPSSGESANHRSLSGAK